MRVTHVITRLIVGGAQENTVLSVRSLRRTPGLDVDLVSGPTTGPEGSLESAMEPGTLTVVPQLVRAVSPVNDLRAFLTLARLFRNTRPDIVHTHSGKAGILGRLAARMAGVPAIVHTIHGPSFGAFQGAAANLVFTAAERAAGRVTHRFIVVADAMARQYLAAGIGRPGQYVRVFSGFDLAPFLEAQNEPELRRRLGLAPEDFVVGKIARLFPLKGHEDLIAAAPEILRRCPSARFLLVGDGILRGRLEEEIRRRGLSSRFVFAGLVPPSEMARYVGVMDALVHLSRREGLPRALPQAMAGGKPVIALDYDGAGEACLDGRTGFLLSAGDLGGLAERIATLQGGPELRARLGGAGKAFAREHFSAGRMARDILEVYRSLVPAGSLPAIPD